jgi:hypothetical protein
VDIPQPIRLPVATAAANERDLAEIVAAIELVARRAATRVTVTGLEDPQVVASDGLVVAQGAGVEFRLGRDPETGAIRVVVGPIGG